MSRRPELSMHARLCVACGRLMDPAVDRPYRADPRIAALDHCSHCGAPEIVDLGDMTAALTMAEALESDRVQRRPAATRILRRFVVVAAPTVALAVVGLLVLMLGLATNVRGWQVSALLALLVTLLFGVPALFFTGRLILREWQRTAARPLPGRWRMALPGAGASSPAVDAPAVAEEATLTAPISGRPCVAYEVGVREDEDADARPGSWILIEQRSAPLRVGERAIAGDGAHLALIRRRMPRPPPGPGRTRADHFLRSRGLDADDEALHLFEAVIEDGERVALIDVEPPILRALAR